MVEGRRPKHFCERAASAVTTNRLKDFGGTVCGSSVIESPWLTGVCFPAVIESLWLTGGCFPHVSFWCSQVFLCVVFFGLVEMLQGLGLKRPH
jgi:hypothetical protein